jgi:hypothetical protein
MTPGFSMTWPASVRCTGWLGRICNDLRRLKNKCRNLHFAVDTTAYVMQSLRMTNETRIKIVKRNGKNVALYNTKLVTGEWYKFWFKTTLAEAKQMLTSGKAVLA